MYLSQLTFHASDPVVLRALGDLHAMHRLILQGFPDATDVGRVLYRVNRPQHSRDLPTVLVQSEVAPDWNRETAERKALTQLAQVMGPKEWEPQFVAGQLLRFRLHATPTVKKKFGEGSERPGHRRIGLNKEEEQRDWIIRKGALSGFEIVDTHIIPLGKLSGKSPRDGMITHTGVEFEGTLKVTDPPLFATAIRSGIGAGKGFGFGLLSVAPLR